LLLDMNLSPAWVGVLRESGFEAIHWSSVGSPGDADEKILLWAKRSGRVVLTHDLDFGAIPSATGAEAPSVLQLRVRDVSPTGAKELVVDTLTRAAVLGARGMWVCVCEGHWHPRPSCPAFSLGPVDKRIRQREADAARRAGPDGPDLPQPLL
jgi:predicted nuclease of predicted toxin-antitoxin system